MAISFVGSKTFGHNAITAQSCSLTDLLDSAGASVSPAAGDVVLVNYVHAMATTATRTLAQCTPSGYSNTHAAIVQADDSNAVSLALSYKLMGGTPDTSVSIPAASATTAGVSCVIECWRGVDTTTITSTTPTTASGNNSALANPPSITTPSAPSGCVVIGAFGGAAASGAVFTNTGATPYDSTTNVFKSLANTTGTNDAVSGMGAKTGLAVSTAFDAAVTGSTTTNTGSWAAASIVMRPPLASASLSVTLDALTSSSTGTVLLQASASPTLGALTSSATGTVLLQAAAAPTLGALTLSATGAVQVKAQSAPTLAALALSSTGALVVGGQLTTTLGDLSLSSTAELVDTTQPIQASLAVTLAGVSSEAEGTLSISGQGVVTLGALTLSAAGRWVRIDPVAEPPGDVSPVPSPPVATVTLVPSPGIQIVAIPLPPVAVIE